MTRYGSRMDGIREELALAEKSALPAPRPCPRCSRQMERSWLSAAEVEFKSCPACRGIWFDGDGLHVLRAYHKSRADRAARAAAPPTRPPPPSRAWIVVVCMTLAAGWLSYRVLHRPKIVAAVPSALTYRDYEREALQRKANAFTAERLAHVEEAAEEYASAAGFYYAAILAASRTDEREAWRLELEYANAGESLARLANQQGRFAEAENIQQIRLGIFERYKNVSGQAKAWQGLAETAELGRRHAEAAQRFDKAADFYRRFGNLQEAQNCELRSAAARKSRS